MTQFENVLAVEGVPSIDGRLCLPGSLTWDEGPMPVYGENTGDDPWSVPIIGTIEDIWRDGHLIWASGTWFGDRPEGGLCATTDSVEFVVESERMTFSAARIRAAYISQPAWPQCVVTS